MLHQGSGPGLQIESGGDRSYMSYINTTLHPTLSYMSYINTTLHPTLSKSKDWDNRLLLVSGRRQLAPRHCLTMFRLSRQSPCLQTYMSHSWSHLRENVKRLSFKCLKKWFSINAKTSTSPCDFSNSRLYLGEGWICEIIGGGVIC